MSLPVRLSNTCAECGGKGAEQDGICPICRPLYPVNEQDGKQRLKDEDDE